MANPAQRLIQDQNINILYNGTTPGVKIDVAKGKPSVDISNSNSNLMTLNLHRHYSCMHYSCIKSAQACSGGLCRRKALNDISNSRKPSGFPPVKKDSSINVISIDKDPSVVKGKSSKASEKGKVGGRKALSDLTNSIKPRQKQVASLGRKMNAVAEEADERFLHNHHECIKAQTTIMDKDYFLKSVGLTNNDFATLPSARKAPPFPSKKVEIYKEHCKMEELVEHVLDQAMLCCSTACRSPQSPKTLHMMANCWEDDDSLSDLMVIESPKLK